MPSIKQLVLFVFVVQVLCISVLGYVVLPMNRKSNVTFEERHEQFKRENTPLGGGINRSGFYFVELQVGSQKFRVDIVRCKACFPVPKLSADRTCFVCFLYSNRILEAQRSISSVLPVIMYVFIIVKLEHSLCMRLPKWFFLRIDTKRSELLF
jgi:hypothetical protein